MVVFSDTMVYRSNWGSGTLSRHRALQVGAGATRDIAVHMEAEEMFSVCQVPRTRGRESQSSTAHPDRAEQRTGADTGKRPLRSRFPVRLTAGVCAGHGTELTGCKSPCQVFAQPKARRRARASPRGGVWRKPNPKMRGDEQEPDTRCGTPGTSGHVTVKSSMRGGCA
jgi:hypothetical protein